MILTKTSCCAIQDIDRLCSHATPKEAMIAFCQQAILQPPKFGGSNGRKDQISSFYLFTAAVYPSRYLGYGGCYRAYGKAFYAFILDNNLGDVWESPSRPNNAWHPDHENQVYVWMPDHAAILAWWAVNDPDTPGLPEVKTKTATKRKPRKVEVSAIPEPDDLPAECPF